LRKVEVHVTSFSDGAHEVHYACERKNVVVTSYGVSGYAENIELPTEEIALSLPENKVTYTEHDTTDTTRGNVEFRWQSDENAKTRDGGSKKRR